MTFIGLIRVAAFLEINVVWSSVVIYNYANGVWSHVYIYNYANRIWSSVLYNYAIQTNKINSICSKLIDN